MVRIRYKEQNGIMISSELEAGDRILQAIIDLTRMSFSIKDSVGNYLVRDKQGANKQVLLKHARNYLRNYGVMMLDEIRNRRKGK